MISCFLVRFSILTTLLILVKFKLLENGERKKSELIVVKTA